VNWTWVFGSSREKVHVGWEVARKELIKTNTVHHLSMIYIDTYSAHYNLLEPYATGGELKRDKELDIREVHVHGIIRSWQQKRWERESSWTGTTMSNGCSLLAWNISPKQMHYYRQWSSICVSPSSSVVYLRKYCLRCSCSHQLGRLDHTICRKRVQFSGSLFSKIFSGGLPTKISFYFKLPTTLVTATSLFGFWRAPYNT
jgi:hypothetical protein